MSEFRTDMQKHIPVSNPYTDDVLDEVASVAPSEVENRVELAVAAQEACRKISRTQRAKLLLQVAVSVRDQSEEYARLIVSEAGKTITQARKEVSRCINTLTLSAEEAKRTNGETIPFDAFEGSETRQGYFTREPLGLVVGITPYNDPLNLVAHKLGPAIASGNCFILKPSELAPLSAIKLCEEFWSAGFPRDALQIITGDAKTGSALVSQKQIRMVSFTGGLETAHSIIKHAGVKKFAMDLGGNAPVIVMEDCDLEAAVESCISGSFWAAGQNCIGTQRILIHSVVYESFKKAFVSGVKKLKAGDPMDESTDVGPMITRQAATKVESLVNQALQSGTTLLTGNRRQNSLYYPTVLENVPMTEPVWCEEVFAPVVSLYKVDDLTHALELANSAESSLHAGIFTNRLSDALLAADQLQAGGVMINDSSDYRFDAMPFGGFKLGSMGREGVRFAIEEMTQPKVICFNL